MGPRTFEGTLLCGDNMRASAKFGDIPYFSTIHFLLNVIVFAYLFPLKQNFKHFLFINDDPIRPFPQNHDRFRY